MHDTRMTSDTQSSFRLDKLAFVIVLHSQYHLHGYRRLINTLLEQIFSSVTFRVNAQLFQSGNLLVNGLFPHGPIRPLLCLSYAGRSNYATGIHVFVIIVSNILFNESIICSRVAYIWRSPLSQLIHQCNFERMFSQVTIVSSIYHMMKFQFQVLKLFNLHHTSYTIVNAIERISVRCIFIQHLFP